MFIFKSSSVSSGMNAVYLYRMHGYTTIKSLALDYPASCYGKNTDLPPKGLAWLQSQLNLIVLALKT